MARLWLLAFAIFGALSLSVTTVGCSARPSMTQQERQAQQERQSIERPAQALGDEATFTDRMGQIGVVVLVVGITLAGILLPLLLL